MTHQGTRHQSHAKLGPAMFNQQNSQQQSNQDDKCTFPIWFWRSHISPKPTTTQSWESLGTQDNMIGQCQCKHTWHHHHCWVSIISDFVRYWSKMAGEAVLRLVSKKKVVFWKRPNFEGGLVTKQQYRFIIGLNGTFLVWTPTHKVAEADNHYHSNIQGGKNYLNWR